MALELEKVIEVSVEGGGQRYTFRVSTDDPGFIEAGDIIGLGQAVVKFLEEDEYAGEDVTVEII